jgi:hypothetical protein
VVGKRFDVCIFRASSSYFEERSVMDFTFRCGRVGDDGVAGYDGVSPFIGG